jgi:hypothetical protein
MKMQLRDGPTAQLRTPSATLSIENSVIVGTTNFDGVGGIFGISDATRLKADRNEQFHSPLWAARPGGRFVDATTKGDQQGRAHGASRGYRSR